MRPIVETITAATERGPIMTMGAIAAGTATTGGIIAATGGTTTGTAIITATAGTAVTMIIMAGG